MRFVLAILFLLSFAFAGEGTVVRMGRDEFVQTAVKNEPRFLESKMAVLQKEQKVEQVKSGVILPKFEFSMLTGIVPGLKNSLDNIDNKIKEWDFTKMGPYYGMNIQVAQPLNYGQLQLGLRAARADLQQKKMEMEGKENFKKTELLSYYYGYLLAIEMDKLAREGHSQMSKALDKLEEALDEDDESVSQMDVLELKSGFFEIDKAVLDAKASLKKAKLATKFALALPDSLDFAPTETELTEIQDFVPNLDSLVKFAEQNHPDIRRLSAGLEATNMQMELTSAKLAPEFFIMGEFEYAKSWAGDRTSLSKNAFAQDPVNRISGAFGVGLKYKLNFWNQWENYKSARLEHRILRQTESYANEGISLQIAEKYEDFLVAKGKLESARKSLRATEGMLKGAALQYDINPGKASGLLANTYKKNLLMKKDYYFAVYDYNMAVAKLFAQAGYSN
ncbi:MAG: TolC family protein [Fibromonadaceae bacterium]|jgi:outer membrane protein TolC|nr:TolC family protein [Fibromonadaceae bacterium]